MRNVLLSILGALIFLGAAALLAPVSAISKESIRLLGVSQGGTGLKTITDGGVMLGSGTGAVTPMAVLGSGEIIIGDGTTDPAPQTLSGDVTMAASGAVTIAATAVEGSMIAADIVVGGYIQNDVGPFITLASGTLTANTIHMATAAATYTVPSCVSANIGTWVTVIVQDASELVTLDLADASNIFVVGDVDIDTAAHKLTSPTADAASNGSSVTLVCITAEFWHSTAVVGTWLDGGA